MKNSWKIFRALSLVEIIVTCILFTLPFLNGQGFNDARYGAIFFSVFIAIPAVMIANCLCNVFLLPVLFANESVAVFRMVVFWLLWILFLICVAGMNIGFFSLIVEFQRIKSPQPAGFQMYQILALVILSLIALLGIYLLIAQVYFYIKIKKAYERRRIAIADEIGLPEEV